MSVCARGGMYVHTNTHIPPPVACSTVHLPLPQPNTLKGYIQLPNCREMLYFHFSQVMGNPTHLFVGQCVDVDLLRDMQSGQLRIHKVYMHSGYGGQAFHQNHHYHCQQQQQSPLMQQPMHVPPQSPSPSSSSRLRKGPLYPMGVERQRGKVDSEPAASKSLSPTAVSWGRCRVGGVDRGGRVQ